MKIRHVLIIVSSILLLIIIYYVGVMGYQMGIDYGEQNAEKIREKKEIKTKNDSIAPKYVNTLLVQNENRPMNIISYGRVSSSSNINISSEVQGKLSSNIPLKKGSEFSKGQLIIKINDKDAQLAVRARKSNYLNIISLSLPDLIVDFPDQYEKWNNFFNSIQIEKELPSFPSFTNSKEKNFIISRNILSEYYNIQSDEARLKKYNISFIYITHDLATARYFGQRIGILYLGKIVEVGPIDQVLLSPKHPYTQALIDAISEPNPDNLHKEKEIRINEPSDIDILQGCRFRNRCQYVIDECKTEPDLEKIGDEHYSACHVKIN